MGQQGQDRGWAWEDREEKNMLLNCLQRQGIRHAHDRCHIQTIK